MADKVRSIMIRDDYADKASAIASHDGDNNATAAVKRLLNLRYKAIQTQSVRHADEPPCSDDRNRDTCGAADVTHSKAG